MALELASLIEKQKATPATLQLPAPTAWPIVLAFGLTLIFAGLVTSVSVCVLGALLALAGAVGWFRDILPHEAHETVPVSDRVEPITTTRTEVAHVAWITQELNRAWLPLEIYPVSSGIKGGLAGSVVMAILAMAYGIASKHGIWYPINLLAAGFFPARNTTAQIAAFTFAFACFLVSKLATQSMVKQRLGKIINIASGYSLFGSGRIPSYCASKGALVQLTKSMAIELAPFNIQVNAIAPGMD